jgi:tRNA pseudouridine38-40 synthase
MVRIIAGTLLYVGIGRIKESDIPGIIKSRDRKKSGITAGPMGLYLAKVCYGDGGVLWDE